MCCAMLSCSVMSNSLWSHGLKPTRLLCLWEISKQEYWSVLPCPPPWDFPNPGIKPRSPTLQADSLLSEPPGRPLQSTNIKYYYCVPKTVLGIRDVKWIQHGPSFRKIHRITRREGRIQNAAGVLESITGAMATTFQGSPGSLLVRGGIGRLWVQKL